jgi:hypothetical protein
MLLFMEGMLFCNRGGFCRNILITLLLQFVEEMSFCNRRGFRKEGENHNDIILIVI